VKADIKLIEQLKNNFFERPYEIIKENELQYCMVATDVIQKESLLCEYVGIIKRYKLPEQKPPESEEYIEINEDSNGYMYAVFSTCYSNEARFISGIPSNMKDLANCNAVRLIVEGTPRVFIRSI
jgi:hypothetical protein